MSGVYSKPVSGPIEPVAMTPPQPGSPAGQALSARLAAGRLEMQVCTACGRVQYPARELCASCLSTDLDWRAQDGLGTLIATTVVRRPYDPAFQSRPLVRIGLIRLDTEVTVIAFLDEHCPPPRERVRIVALSDPAGSDGAGHGLLVAQAP